jgi:hypothetical protein
MGTTPNFAWPYPERTDPPDGPAQIKALANAADTTVKAVKTTADAAKTTADAATVNLGKLPTRGYAGRTAVNSAGAGSLTKSLTFPVAFAAQPSISTNLTLAVGTNSGWTSRAINGTATGFTMFAAGTASSWSGNIDWAAYELNTTVTALVGPRAAGPQGWHYVIATCWTLGCPKSGEPVSGLLVPDDPEFWGWAGIVCGACAEPITDVVTQEG